MKSLLSIAIALTIGASAFAQHDEKDAAWFDMKSCAICKNMAGVEGFMEKVKWESHIIDNGLLTVTVMPDDLKEKWAEMMKGVEATIAKVEAGEETELCGFCTSMGGLIQAGAKKTEIDSAGGKIMMLTSDDPKVVEKIHAHAKKTITEHEKMMAMMKKHGSQKRK